MWLRSKRLLARLKRNANEKLGKEIDGFLEKLSGILEQVPKEGMQP